MYFSIDSFFYRFSTHRKKNQLKNAAFIFLSLLMQGRREGKKHVDNYAKSYFLST